MKLLWLTDLHLDKVAEKRKAAFYQKLRERDADAVVITGDISRSDRLHADLLDLGRACAPRPVYFTLGNHDFHLVSFDSVDEAVTRPVSYRRISGI